MPKESIIKETIDDMTPDLVVQTQAFNSPIFSADTLRYFRKLLGNVILDSRWNDYLYYSTFFDSSSWPATLTGTGTATYGGGVQLVSTANNDTAAIILNPLSGVTGLETAREDVEQRVRFIVNFDISDFNANVTAYLVKGNRGNNVYYGFKCAGAVLQGVVRNGGGETTIQLLASVVGLANQRLEARFMPYNRIDFYINDVFYGSLSNPINQDILGVGDIYLTKTSGIAQEMHVAFFEYIQKRN